MFRRFVVETHGASGKSTSLTIKKFGRRLTVAIGDTRETVWFMQRVSLAVPRDNAAAYFVEKNTDSKTLKSQHIL